MIKGIALLASGYNDKAIECFSRAIEIEPEYLEAIINMGETLIKENDYHEAMKYYDKALKIRGEDFSLLYQKGFLLRKKEKI